MRTYEVMTIWRPELAETEVRTQVADMESMLLSNGAEVGESDFWGKRRFAYEIDHETEGYYTVVEFQAEPAAVQELERSLSLSDQVLRHKVLRPDR
ncbi:MAG: 30S ribosomal protein S6 [Acidimicrobiia bacterium]